MTYAKSGLFWSQCFLPSLVIRKAQAGGGKSSLGLLWSHWSGHGVLGLALFSIHQTDLTSFSENGRVVKWL